MENNLISKLDSLNLTQIQKRKEIYNIVNKLNKNFKEQKKNQIFI